MAEKFHLPILVRTEIATAGDHPDVFDLLNYRPPTHLAEDSAIPLDVMYKHVNVAYMRSAWDDRKAMYVGFKGGDNQSSHGHLNLGTFVLDAGGTRWAMQLGPDDYDLPGYFDFSGKRFTYYRTGTSGQNTLMLNGANQ